MNVKSIEQTKARVVFPTLRETLDNLINQFYGRGFCAGMRQSELTDFVLKGIEKLKYTIGHYREGTIHDLVSEPKCTLEHSDDNISSVIEELKRRWHSPNEFFAIFDITKGTEAYVDQRVEEILGVPPAQFKTASLDIAHPERSIYYEEDVFHVLRFGLISYFVLSLPGFRWCSQRDHNLIRFRLSTKYSSLEAVRKLPYLTVEKRCYLAYDNVNRTIGVPQYHFDLLSVYPHLAIEQVTNTFITTDDQGELMNAFSYLTNMYLVGIPPKYILLLDERQLHDRNKTVANALCSNIRYVTGKEILLDEHQVADCFAKTIRPKVEEAFNTWEFRSKHNRLSITSDTECVRYAKKLGLLPIPLFVKNMLYDMVVQHSLA